MGIVDDRLGGGSECVSVERRGGESGGGGGGEGGMVGDVGRINKFNFFLELHSVEVAFPALAERVTWFVCCCCCYWCSRRCCCCCCCCCCCLLVCFALFRFPAVRGICILDRLLLALIPNCMHMYGTASLEIRTGQFATSVALWAS